MIKLCVTQSINNMTLLHSCSRLSIRCQYRTIRPGEACLRTSKQQRGTNETMINYMVISHITQ